MSSLASTSSSSVAVAEVNAFTFDTIEFLRSIKDAFSKSRQLQSVTVYDCTVCQAKIPRVAICAHIFTNHTDKRRPKTLLQHSVDGPHFTCLCGSFFRAHYVEAFVVHLVGCLGFPDLPKSVQRALRAFHSTPEYSLCQEIIANEGPIHESIALEHDEAIEKIHEAIEHPPFTANDISKVFGIHVTNDRIKSKLHVHTLRIQLLNHASRYLCENVALDNQFTCNHCRLPINSLQYIQHCISEHLDPNTYGAR